MSFNLENLVKYRPYLYHLTSRQNLASIRLDRQLRCANRLLDDAKLEHVAGQRRREHLVIDGENGPLLIRDQEPLSVGSINFEDGWTLERFVRHINAHVFFWPGTSEGPIQVGRNHFERYRHEGSVILRIATGSVTPLALLFSRYNSGAPRCSGGKYSPRGPGTYLRADQFTGTVSNVVEVVSAGGFSLPDSTEFSDSLGGPWQSLFAAS